jgi:propionyl-CoA synthetase
VIGIADSLKGQVPAGFVVLKAGVTEDHEKIKTDLVQSVRDEIGAIANFKKVAVVKRLPKTRSGKILRGTMRKIADRQEFTMPSTIDDPAILGEIETALREMM